MVSGNWTLPGQLLKTCDDGLFFCMAQWTNTVSNGLFWALALLSFSVIVFMATARLGNVRAYGYASFVGLIGGVWLVIAGLMSWDIASAFILNGIVAIGMMILSEKFNTL